MFEVVVLVKSFINCATSLIGLVFVLVPDPAPDEELPPLILSITAEATAPNPEPADEELDEEPPPILPITAEATAPSPEPVDEEPDEELDEEPPPILPITAEATAPNPEPADEDPDEDPDEEEPPPIAEEAAAPNPELLEEEPELLVCNSLIREVNELFKSAFVGQYFRIPSAIFIAPKITIALPLIQSGLRESLATPNAVILAPQAKRVKAFRVLKFSSNGINLTSS